MGANGSTISLTHMPSAVPCALLSPQHGHVSAPFTHTASHTGSTRESFLHAHFHSSHNVVHDACDSRA